jgi:hypothetical protein
MPMEFAEITTKMPLLGGGVARRRRGCGTRRRRGRRARRRGGELEGGETARQRAGGRGDDELEVSSARELPSLGGGRTATADVVETGGGGRHSGGCCCNCSRVAVEGRRGEQGDDPHGCPRVAGRARWRAPTVADPDGFVRQEDGEA